MRKALIAILTLIIGLNVISPTSANPNASKGKGVPNANASGYWTEERRNNAIPREFQFEVGAVEGKLVPQARKGGSGGGGSTTSGTTYWNSSNQGQLVALITGKVFFDMGGKSYVCSGSLVEDGNTEIAVVITAAHCLWDNATRSFATNWVFYPNYDKDAGIQNRKSYAASSLYAPIAFTSQSTFNTTAILNDFAFAVLPALDLNIAGLPLISTASSFTGNKGDAFGYPASSPFNGEELVYSTGSVSTDRNTGNKTWRLPSSMTGGASGGPWYNGYTNGTRVGSVSSVNSYKYGNDKNSMYGPKFNSLTNDLYAMAKSGICSPNSTINCK
jgi:hypothetical protein